MAIPEQVLKKQKEMEELMNQGTTEDESAPDTVQESDTGASEDSQPESQEQEVDFDALRQTHADLQRKHEELQKRYKAEVSPLQKQVDQLQKGSSWMQQQLIERESELRRLREQPPPEQKQEAPKFHRVDVDRLKQDYDDESLIAMGQSLNDYADVFERQNAELAELKQQIGQQGQWMQRSSHDAFMAKVYEQIPDWQAVQQAAIADGRMDRRVPGTPWTYNDALVEAQKRGDAQAAIEILRGWKPQEPATEDQPEMPKEHIVPDGNRSGTSQNIHKKKSDKVTTAQLFKLSTEVSKDPQNRELRDKYTKLYDRWFFEQEESSGR